MKLTLYNSLSRKKEPFKPRKRGAVGVYSCGPTVYDFAHIGNMRSFIFSDILRRTLEYNKYKVKLVMNITDVGHLTDDADAGDDKIEKAAKKTGRDAWEVAAFYTKQFERDRAALNILPPSKQPKATDHIFEQITLIQKLEKKGYTYRTSDGIYFNTGKYPAYGKLSRQKASEKRAGARVALSDEKRNPTDFALWKFSPASEKRQMEWKSPWGVGFPGWHIECSAMSAKYLGQPFDIHTGGIDHLAVHHEGEIAQSEAAAGKPLANIWMHSEFLVLRDAKMSKSLGNIMTVSDLARDGFDPLAYRYLTLGTHYRKPLVFTTSALKTAQTALEHLRHDIESLPRAAKTGVAAYEKKFLAAVNDDLNMPKALAVTWNLVKARRSNPAAVKASILKFDQVLGLGLSKVKKTTVKVTSDVRNLIAARERARKNKNWQEADALREKIAKLGFTVEDTPSGPQAKSIQ